MRKILQRTREPSTHAGLSALAMLLAALFPAYSVVINAAAGVFAAAAVALPEGR